MDVNKKILVIEDEVVLASVILEKLKAAGYITQLVHDVREAVKVMKESGAALIIVDSALARDSAQLLLEAKSHDSAISGISVIIFSRLDTVVDASRVKIFDNVSIISKAPADVDSIVSQVKVHFSSSGNAVGGTLVNNDTEKKPAAEEKKSPLKGKTVLWIEDDKFLSEILSRKFNAIGCNLVRVPAADQAFVFLETHKPDVILLDILLPGMNGLDILQRVRMDEKMRSIPVIMLSNTSQSSDFDKSKMLGAQKFLVKAAVSLDEIIREVGALVK